MNKVLFSLILMLMSIAAKAEIWYYLPSGQSPESSGGVLEMVIIVIKDNSGQLWLIRERKDEVKAKLSRNINYYVDSFNRGSHQEPSRQAWDSYVPPFMTPPVIQGEYNENKIFSGNLTFYKKKVLEKTGKCIVVDDGSNKLAISLDYKTLVVMYIGSHRYYSSIPGERFVVRRNVDDYF